MTDNFMQLNNDKTKVMIIAPDNVTPKIRHPLKAVTRHLGVIFDRSMCLNSLK